MAFSPLRLRKYYVPELPVSSGTKSKIRKVIKENKRSGKITDLTLRRELCDELGSKVGMSVYRQLEEMRAGRKNKSSSQTKKRGIIASIFGIK